MADKIHEKICIVCPVGCHLTIYEGESIRVENAQCKRGEAYGVKELTNPTRIVTSTVKITGAMFCRLPVRTKEDIPKHLIRACMEEINKVEVMAPIKMGDVIIKNVLGTGVDVVASRSMAKK